MFSGLPRLVALTLWTDVIKLCRAAHSRLVDYARKGRRDKRWRTWLRLEPPAVEAVDGRDFGKVFRTLKPRDATLLWLAYVEGDTHADIAASLRLGRASVKVMLSRARGRLRDLLKARGFTQGSGT